jgi:hypothetical protein
MKKFASAPVSIIRFSVSSAAPPYTNLNDTPAVGDGRVSVRFPVIAGTTLTLPALAVAVSVVSASLNVMGVTCNPDPSKLNSVVNAPVVEFFATTSNPSSDLTGPEKVVLAMIFSCLG